MEAAKVIAGLTRMVRDLDLAEDLAQESLLSRWKSGRMKAFRRSPVLG
jgi:predicted RNA polymerase sigma factor